MRFIHPIKDLRVTYVSNKCNIYVDQDIIKNILPIMMYHLKTRNYTTCYDNSFYDITNNQNRFSLKNT